MNIYPDQHHEQLDPDRAGVIEKFGIPPELIIDYLALLGTSRTIFPVPRWRENRPWSFCRVSVGWMISTHAWMRWRIGISRRQNHGRQTGRAQRAGLSSYLLATIKTDVEMPMPLAELENGQPDLEELLSLFRQLEFKTWIEETQAAIAGDGSSVSSSTEADSARKGTEETRRDRQRLPAGFN